MNPSKVKDYLLTLQQNIVATLENLDGASFRTDQWQREGGGGGITRVIEGGQLFERGGVNFSHVFGDKLPASATAHRPELAGSGFEAMGVSLVLHPRNPWIPTVHMNVRFFRVVPAGQQTSRNDEANSRQAAMAGREGEAHSTRQYLEVQRGECNDADKAMPKQSEPEFWFGGGMDLTPYYGFVEDAVHFHQTCKNALAPFGEALYPEFKAWCDRYFFLKHRQEPRGVGGIFFDDYNAGGFDAAFALMQSVGNAFLPAYVLIVERRRELEYGQRERDWQAFRRGRYVEFNLVFDRGTLFGLQSGGRTESILMSMPPVVNWKYDYQPEAGTPEARLLRDFLCEKNWLGI